MANRFTRQNNHRTTCSPVEPTTKPRRQAPVLQPRVRQNGGNSHHPSRLHRETGRLSVLQRLGRRNAQRNVVRKGVHGGTFDQALRPP